MKSKNLIIGFSFILLLNNSCSNTGEDQLKNLPPNKPVPTNGVSYSCEVLRPTLSWSCNDPDNDNLTYILKIGENETNMDVKVSNLAATEYTFAEELEKSKKYFWQIIVSDGKDETSGDIWDFSTVGDPVISVIPSTPIIISPKWNVPAGNVTFIWSAVVDDKGMENITFILNVNGEETEIEGSSMKELSVSAGECDWYVTAFDEDGNGSESEHITIQLN